MAGSPQVLDGLVSNRMSPSSIRSIEFNLVKSAGVGCVVDEPRSPAHGSAAWRLLSRSSGAETVPGIERQPLKKITPDEAALLHLLHRWRDEAIRKGRSVARIAVAFEAGRDGFWLARWLAKQGIEVHVVHSSSVAVSREHRRAKTNRLDTAMLTRVFLG
jgi:hypothetical protein